MAPRGTRRLRRSTARHRPNVRVSSTVSIANGDALLTLPTSRLAISNGHRQTSLLLYTAEGSEYHDWTVVAVGPAERRNPASGAPPRVELFWIASRLKTSDGSKAVSPIWRLRHFVAEISRLDERRSGMALNDHGGGDGR